MTEKHFYLSTFFLFKYFDTNPPRKVWVLLNPPPPPFWKFGRRFPPPQQKAQECTLCSSLKFFIWTPDLVFLITPCTWNSVWKNCYSVFSVLTNVQTGFKILWLLLSLGSWVRNNRNRWWKKIEQPYKKHDKFCIFHYFQFTLVFF